MLKVLKEDIEFICKNYDNELKILDGKSVLVTGATGLIGFNLINTLSLCKYNIKIIALARNIDKAERMFGKKNNSELKYVIGDVRQVARIDEDIDYIIHAASQTSSKLFVSEPVETVITAFEGTRNMLELAKSKSVEGFIYLSTMEIYGTPKTDEKILEDHGTNVDTMDVRSSYPESKRLCETLCSAYYSEFGIPIKIARLTQTFGPGVQYDDGRVFAEFARCVIENRNIVLKTKGETKRNYLYTADAVTAIITILLKGKNGQAYNVANENTYCSIYEMADMLAKEHGNNIKVVIEEQDVREFGYAPPLKMNLDTQKICCLGWKPQYEMPQMFENLIISMTEEK